MAGYVSDEFGGGHRPEPRPVGAVRWKADADEGSTPVESAHNLLQAAAREHGAFVDRMSCVASQYTQEGLKTQLANFQQSDAGQIPDAVEQFASAIAERAKADYENKIRGLTQAGDTAQELRKQRTIDRAARQLDSAGEAERPAIAARLIAEAADDPAAVRTLVAELPSFGVDDNVIRAAATKARPELTEAEERVTKAQQSAAILRNDARRLRESFKDGRKLAVPLVDPAKYDPDK
jgi:hypothetical protein